MKKVPTGKYRNNRPVEVENFSRTWADKVLEKAPIWCSVDLRDGNQALINPMDLEKKLSLFHLLVRLGFKNIEVGFPSASKTEFDFLRKLIDDKLIPDDVTIQVLVQAREHLIKRTFEALDGAKKVVIHLYNSTSVSQRKIVFKKSQEEIISLALQGVEWVKEEIKNSIKEDNSVDISLEYSPESFTGTELSFARDISNAVIKKWHDFKNSVKDSYLDKNINRKLILNLPATVELTTPNVYADSIEWISRELINREDVLISLHAHNDRGTAVGATELGLLAGGDRVEGTLLGNGERTGNVDILTLALNMTTQGIDSELDFSDINSVVEVVEKATEINTHIRHPYVGELVYTAFSGSHQDAINKGLNYQKSKSKDDPFWEVPYLPIDPSDVGRTYEDLIRINSQSGKGGIAFILEKYYDFELPKKIHPEIGKLVQAETDKQERELSREEIFEIFKKSYLEIDNSHIEYVKFERTNKNSDEVSSFLTFKFNDEIQKVKGEGNGILNACKKAIEKVYPNKFDVTYFTEYSRGQGSDAEAVAFIQIETEEFDRFFGIGIDTDTTKASIKAIFSALNRAF